MNVPKGYTSSVFFSVPDNASDAIAVVISGTETAEAEVEIQNNRAEVRLPYRAVHDEANIHVVLSFTLDGQTYTRSKEIEVYTPYLDLWEIRDIMEEEAYSVEECWTVELAVRNVINVYCGQDFGKRYEAIEFRGDDRKVISLPKRLHSLAKVSHGDIVDFDGIGGTGPSRYSITGDGWFLSSLSHSPSFAGEVYSSDPIEYPSHSGSRFSARETYKVEGLWGYSEVPSAVVEAAKLLLNDFACEEQLYRDRYIRAFTASDWRVQFDERAFNDTGNARANLLLAPFRQLQMVVI